MKCSLSPGANDILFEDFQGANFFIACSPRIANIFKQAIWFFFAALSLIGCSTKLQMEAHSGNVQSVMELLEKGENISETDIRGWTALHYAARAGQDTVVKLLLSEGAEIDAQGDKGETPLLMAAYNCHKSVVRILLEKGANFSIKGKIDSGSYSGSWMSPLLIASGNRCDPTILKDLLNAGADGNEIEHKYGWSPLIFAANTGYLQAVKVLLSAGVAVNHQANDRLTALIAAAGKGSKEVVQVLLNAGADPIIIAGQGRGPLHKELEPTDTALSVAKRRGNREVVELLEAAEGMKN